MTRIHRLPPLIAAILAGILVSACSSYTLGDRGALPFQTLYVKPVVNDSYAAQIDAILSAQIREYLIRDPRVKLVSNEQAADATLEVTATRYTRRASARRAEDTGKASNFDLFLDSRVSLFDNRSGETYMADREVSFRITSYVDNPYQSLAEGDLGDFTQSEYQVTPKLTRELARRIVDATLETW